MALRNHPLLQAANYDAEAANQVTREAEIGLLPHRHRKPHGGRGDIQQPHCRWLSQQPASSRTANRTVWKFISSSPTSGARRTWWARRAWEQRPLPKARSKPQQDVLLAVNRAYFGVLRAEAVLKVAEETVKARQILTDQITTLEKNKLRSMLDVSFAEVNLAQAQLLLVQAQNDREGGLRGIGHRPGTRQSATVRSCRGTHARRATR